MSWLPDSLVFVWPSLFWLLPLPLLVYAGMPPMAQNEAALRLPTFDVLAGIDQARLALPSWSRLVLLCLIWLLTVAAAARPQWVGNTVQIPTTGRDLLVAVDLSGSMNTPDMVSNGESITRIAAVKKVVGDFVTRRTGDRLGLILFGTNAYLHVPLTFDRQVVKQQLEEAQIGFAGENTAIGDGIAIAVKKLRDRPATGRVLILLTDGVNNSGAIDPQQAADLAKLAGIKIYTIGIGADSMVVRNFFFSQKVNPSADLDEKALTYIATSTGGKYFRARDPKQLEEIYQEIDRLDPVEQDKETFRPIRELFFYPLTIAVILSFLLLALFVFADRYTLRSTPGASV